LPFEGSQGDYLLKGGSPLEYTAYPVRVHRL
jgi:hypothetical protein